MNHNVCEPRQDTCANYNYLMLVNSISINRLIIYSFNSNILRNISSHLHLYKNFKNMSIFLKLNFI